MWFLQVESLVIILLAVLCIGFLTVLSQKTIKSKLPAKVVLTLFNVIFVFYISKELCYFYLAYVAVTFILVRIMGLIKHEVVKRIAFVLFSILFTVPFFYTRLFGFFTDAKPVIELIGISYNMLKAIDALFYVYYADKKITAFSYINFMFFIPTFTAGPIFRFRDFEKSFANPAELTPEIFESNVKRIIRGLFKKIVLLYFVSVFFNKLLTYELNTFYSVLIIALSYFMLYIDLSGYSDIAVSMGKIMGYNVPENFKKAFASPTMTQFWRNWHVSLGDWIREHIFVLLNGKKLSKPVSAVVGFSTMLIMSLWHSFTLPFLIGGVYNGLLLAIENVFGITTLDKRKTKKPIFVLRCMLTNTLFAFNTLFLIVDFETLKKVLAGLINLF